jgi:hypothetical protein
VLCVREGSQDRGRTLIAGGRSRYRCDRGPSLAGALAPRGCLEVADANTNQHITHTSELLGRDAARAPDRDEGGRTRLLRDKRPAEPSAIASATTIGPGQL